MLPGSTAPSRCRHRQRSEYNGTSLRASFLSLAQVASGLSRPKTDSELLSFTQTIFCVTSSCSASLPNPFKEASKKLPAPASAPAWLPTWYRAKYPSICYVSIEAPSRKRLPARKCCSCSASDFSAGCLPQPHLHQYLISEPLNPDFRRSRTTDHKDHGACESAILPHQPGHYQALSGRPSFPFPLACWPYP